MRYVVFDTETPNRCNDRISQIGFCVVEDGIMGPERCFLVNPECRFDEFNIMLTGIRPEQCRCEPDFAELWRRELEEVFSEGVLVAHNAPFDMAVLAKCLRAYGLRWKHIASYIDTVRLARRAFPTLSNHRLDTLAYRLGLELEHHDAGSDAAACAHILLACMERGAAPEDFLRGYDMRAMRTLRPANI